MYPVNILLLGGGGREHALAWKLRESPLCGALFVAPGNAGTAALAQNVAMEATDFAALAELVRREDIGMVVVGPEQPLVAGVVDFFAGTGVRVVGPSAAAAQLEGSKAFSKAFMRRHGIPTADYAAFDAAQAPAALAYVETCRLPIVVKASGLAAGKGVVIAHTREEARDSVREMLTGSAFGEAGRTVVIEAFLDGVEMSVFVLTDGQAHVLLPSAKDYKRVGEGHTGPNTGGMGAVSPVPFASPGLMARIAQAVVRPTVAGIASEGLDYKGFIFIGLMIVGDTPYVLEYNVRMGDPETEVVMPRLDCDLVGLLSRLFEGTLAQAEVGELPQAAATVMLVSGGYPGAYTTGHTMAGIEAAEAAGCMAFHAGTRLDAHGQPRTAGGRVMALTALAPTLAQACARAQAGAEAVQFEGKYYRRDIGLDVL